MILEVPPATQVVDILAFIQDAVNLGTLAGDGPGASAGNRLSALINMIEPAAEDIATGDIASACTQLAATAYEQPRSVN